MKYLRIQFACFIKEKITILNKVLNSLAKVDKIGIVEITLRLLKILKSSFKGIWKSDTACCLQLNLNGCKDFRLLPLAEIESGPLAVYPLSHGGLHVYDRVMRCVTIRRYYQCEHSPIYL